MPDTLTISQTSKALCELRQKLASRSAYIESQIRKEDSESTRFPNLPCSLDVQAKRNFIEEANTKLTSLQQQLPTSESNNTRKTQQLASINRDLAQLNTDLEQLHLAEFKKIYQASQKGLFSTIRGCDFFNHPWSGMHKILKNKKTTMDDIYRYADKNRDSRTYVLLLASPSLLADFNDFRAREMHGSTAPKKPKATCRW